ncbi:MAG: SH3 domain-containing protein [Christensenellaceae bacterium]|jgi:uncharacterized protein YraI|nr:SH3 domain-containing protein [Christensenellaceae bacterium]
MKAIGKKGLSIALCMGLLLGLLVWAPGSARADIGMRKNLPALTLGTGSTTPTEVGFAGRRWIAVGQGSSGLAGAVGDINTLTLLLKGSETLGDLPSIPSGNSTFHASSNAYGDSALLSAMNAAAAALNTAAPKEYARILPRPLGDIAGTSAVADARLWPLSAAEASLLTPAARTALGDWWLRSPGTSAGLAAKVSADGSTVDTTGAAVNTQLLVRPAMKINSADVILTSSIVGGKSNASVGLPFQPLASLGSAVKFTLLDAYNAATNPGGLRLELRGPASQSGATLTFSYQNATTGSNQYLSAVLVPQNSDEVQYYGKFLNVASAASGTLSIPVSGVAQGNYTLLVFNEQVNGDNFSDFASATVSMSLGILNGIGTVSNFGGIIEEASPNATIDFINEELANLTPNAAYTVAAGAKTANATGRILIDSNWIGINFVIIKKAAAANGIDSPPQTLSLPPRPEKPQPTGVNASAAGRSDGKITGVNANMEYRLSAAPTYTQVTGTEIANLAAGSYQVRLKATTASFASLPADVTVGTGSGSTTLLNVSAPAFDGVAVGYARPDAKSISITNSGSGSASITSVTVSNTSYFEISGSGSQIGPNERLTTWKVQPKAGLAAGVYQATITVGYNGISASDTVTFKVGTSDKPNLVVLYGLGSGSYSPGQQVGITASMAPIDQEFDKWVSSGGGSFANATSPVTTFTMPSNDVTITATYKSKSIGQTSSYSVAARRLNVRSGPSTKSSILGQFTRGSVVQVISVSGGWAQIQYGNGVAYLSMDYLRPIQGSEPGWYTIKASWLNIRAWPSTSASKFGALRKGSRIYVLAIENGWARIEFGAGPAYLSAEYLN